MRPFSSNEMLSGCRIIGSQATSLAEKPSGSLHPLDGFLGREALGEDRRSRDECEQEGEAHEIGPERRGG